jgi:N-acetylated-alpha-linked acidic dipeptidase
MSRAATIAILLALGAPALAQIAPSADSPGLWCVAPERRASHAAYERDLNAVASAAALRQTHRALTAEPHPAGTSGDHRVIEYLADYFRTLGLDTRIHWLDLYLARPVEAELELVLRDDASGAQSETRIGLPVKEPVLAEDPYTADEALDIGWNAFAATGDVTAEVVYANYGTKEDFERLDEMGVSVAGRVVLARYGRNFRGYKARFAEARGAAGLIMYTDPEDSGYVRGLMYPEGGYANGDQIQRGSILTLPHPGDPLTPGHPATHDATRLDPAEVGFPTIPVQPVGWNAAAPIMRAMAGPVAPEAWQGGLPFNYRVTGGPGVLVRLRVEQERTLMRTANVTGTLHGTGAPEQLVVVGGHHDAWTHGAGDPCAGLMLILESARCFAQLANEGHRPRRSIVFAAWAAEEYGLMGSTEWVEANRDALAEHGVAYLNLDMSAMGPSFGASAAPTLKPLILDATRDVPHCADADRSVHDSWADRFGVDEPSVGTMGGGSDHVGFYCHLGIPSMSLGAWGSKGVSYHSAYDNIRWYQRVVGDDYLPALMLTRVTNLVLARLAGGDVAPLAPSRYARDLPTHLASVAARAEALGVALDTSVLDDALERLETAGDWCEERIAKLNSSGKRHRRAEANRRLVQLERAWLFEGLAARPFYRSLWVATDADSGYAAWLLPHLRAAVEARDEAAAADALRTYEEAISRLVQRLEALGAST